jgi:two-component sensor histidine kinase
MDNNPAAPNLNFLQRGGEMGSLMRGHDWSATPVGPPETWPQTLKTTIRLLLNTQHPMFIWWGEDLIQFYNDAYRQTMGPERHPSALGQRGRECWDEIWPIIGPQIEHVMAGKGATWNEQHLVPVTRHGSKEQVWWTYGYSPIDDESGVGGVLVICTDVNEEVKARTAFKAEGERLRELFQQAPGFMAVLRGPEHVFEIINTSYLQLVGHRRDIVGKSVREALPEIEGQGYFELLDAVFATGDPFLGRNMPVMLQREPGSAVEQRFIDLVYQPTFDGTGKITGIFAEGYDVTDRVEGEKKQKLLLRELNHRVKNLFAVASGMVTLSARSASTPQEMARNLRGRLDALARANDLIRPGLIGADEGQQEGTTMETLVRAVLLPYVDEARAHDRECIVFNGPAVPVGSDAVTNLALILHESATNAAKYGALSSPDGSIRVDWTVKQSNLYLRWEESNGPAIAEPPVAKGFGSSLVERSVTGPLQGHIEYDWKPDGLTMHVTVPLERLDP